MAYLGRPGATAPLTSADIPDNSITAAKIVADTIAAGDIGNDAVGTAELANDVVISTSGAITTTGAFTSVGIDDNASGAVAITIDSDEDVTLTSDLKLSQAGGILYLGRASDAAQIHRIYSDSGNNLKIASDLSSGGSISFVPSSGSGTAMTLAADGNVGIGQPTPQTDNSTARILHVGSSSDGSSGIVIEDNERQWEIMNNGSLYFYSGSTLYFSLRGDNGHATFPASSQRLGVGTDPSTPLHVVGDNESGYVCYFINDGNHSNRYGIELNCGADDSSGTNYAVRWNDGNGTDQGFVTFSGGTVSYGAFTAVHDVQLPDADNENGYPYGTLVETTEIYYKRETERGIEYKVKKTSSAYSKAVLGAYSGKHESTAGDVDVRYKESDTIPEGKNVGDIKETIHEERFDNLHQVCVLGDGHILCNGEKGNISIGDGICTSSAEGQGMKADKMAMIIGIAQEDVTFSGSESKLVAVQYGLQQFTPWTE